MKLLAKYSLINLITVTGLLLAGSIVYYFVVREIVLQHLSQAEAENLLRKMVWATTGIFLGLLVLSAFINGFFVNRLWHPFYTTLGRSLKEFNLTTTTEVYLPESNIQEFNYLNRSFEEMAMRVSREYENLKAFADNVFHDMQTPLSIIHSRLASLIHTAEPNQVSKLRVIYDVAERLIEHNERLLLLASIESGKYHTIEPVNIRLLIENKLKHFDILIKDKQLELTYTLEDVSFSMNRELAELLIDDLLSNAIRHNYTGGNITCSLTKWKLAISNTGAALTFDKEDLFKRFPKNPHSDGMGPGLAVVKKICDRSGLSVAYVYTNGVHTFNILF